MKSVVVYESMFGNTRAIAEAIGAGLASSGPVEVMPLANANEELLHGADLVVVGAPTHVHGMSRPSTRSAAAKMAADPAKALALDAEGSTTGVREWLDALAYTPRLAAAFDTRAGGPALLTGRASKVIARRLRRRGLVQVLAPESFVVTGRNTLRPVELERARHWGEQLARAAQRRTPVLA